MNSDIYQCSDYLEFLRARLEMPSGPLRRKKSRQQWAKDLGYRSARSIGMILEGERLPSSQMLLQLTVQMKLDESQKKYLELLVLQEKMKRSGRSTKKVDDELKRINPQRKPQKILDPIFFKYVSEWYHFVIREMISSQNFRLNTSWICERLKGFVNEAQVTQALENMKVLKLIEVKEQKAKVLSPSVTTTYDVPSPSIRSHHQQMMNQAIRALEEESVNRREFASLTFRMSKKDLPKIKEKIREFRKHMEATFESDDSPDIFQMNIQLFPHTRPDQEDNDVPPNR